MAHHPALHPTPAPALPVCPSPYLMPACPPLTLPAFSNPAAGMARLPKLHKLRDPSVKEAVSKLLPYEDEAREVSEGAGTHHTRPTHQLGTSLDLWLQQVHTHTSPLPSTPWIAACVFHTCPCRYHLSQPHLPVPSVTHCHFCRYHLSHPHAPPHLPVGTICHTFVCPPPLPAGAPRHVPVWVSVCVWGGVMVGVRAGGCCTSLLLLYEPATHSFCALLPHHLTLSVPCSLTTSLFLCPAPSPPHTFCALPFLPCMFRDPGDSDDEQAAAGPAKPKPAAWGPKRS